MFARMFARINFNKGFIYENVVFIRVTEDVSKTFFNTHNQVVRGSSPRGTTIKNLNIFVIK